MLLPGGFGIFTNNPSEMVAYYTRLLEREPDWQGGEFKGWYCKNQTAIFIGPHSEVSGKNKSLHVMMTFVTTDMTAECERLKAIPGTVVVQEPYNPQEDPTEVLATFQDLDGNYFQLVQPSENTLSLFK